MEPGPQYHQLTCYKTKMHQGMLDRMYKRRCKPQNKNFKTHIILSFPGDPRGQKCKIPIVRFPKPAVFAVEPAPQDHQLTFSKARIPRNPKGQKCKIPIARSSKPALFAVEPAPHDHQLTFSNTRLPRNPKGQKCKIPIVRLPKPALFAVEPAPQDHQLTFSKTGLPRNPKGQKCKILIVRLPKPSLFAVEPGPQYHQLTCYKTKMHQGMLDRMYKRRCNPKKKNFKTHIILSFPGDPRGQKCKILIVRSPKPAVFAVEPAPQDHQLTFSKARIPRNPKGQKCKIPIARSSKPALFAVNLHLTITNLHFPTPDFPGILRAKNVRSLL